MDKARITILVCSKQQTLHIWPKFGNLPAISGMPGNWLAAYLPWFCRCCLIAQQWAKKCLNWQPSGPGMAQP
jgi:hypothetical protein